MTQTTSKSTTGGVQSVERAFELLDETGLLGEVLPEIRSPVL